MDARFAAPSGREIYYEEAGAGRPLLAIHGVGGGAYFFRGLPDRLGSGFRVIAIDLPGTGRSIPRGSTAALDTRSMTMEGWVSDLRALVEFQIGEPVVLVGHSLGTIVALEAWRAWRELIAGLVFVGGLPEVRPVVRERLQQRLVTVANEGLSELGPEVSPANFSRASFRDRPEIVGLFERAFEQQLPSVYSRSIEILLESNATAVVPTVTAPVCSISGADDPYAPPDDVRACLAQLPAPPRQVVVLPDVGHLPFFEAPEAFARAIGEFLKSYE
jgi:pimeloyl-ACP methyl ester carboxylesterase